MHKKRIAIFASGTGSNALNIINFFKGHPSIEIAFVMSNRANAPIVTSAHELGIKTMHFTNQEVADGNFLCTLCKDEAIDWIVLAGYLRLIPVELIKIYRDKMINLHPSLLPKYGGKGMHGQNVHLAVLENKEVESGITIHFVNEEFDKGRIIAQFHCGIDPSDKIEDLEMKIRYLEHSYLPTVIQNTILR